MVRTMTGESKSPATRGNSVGRPSVNVLSAERIADAALAMIDGGKDFSMRSLAKTLKVSTPSLYYHVRNKDELANLIRDLLISRQSIPATPSDDWVEEARMLVRKIWEAYSTHPRLVVLLMDSPLTSHSVTAVYERLAHSLQRAGLESDHVALAMEILDGFALGNGLGHVRAPDSWGETEPGSALTESIAAWNQLRHPLSMAFDIGLDALLDQIRSGAMFRDKQLLRCEPAGDRGPAA